MVTLVYLLMKLVDRIDRRIYLAAETILKGAERLYQVFQMDAPDHENVDITRRCLRTRRDGTENTGDLDSRREGLEGLAQKITDAGSLGHQATELGVDGTMRIGLEVSLLALANADDDPHSFQAGQLTAEIGRVLA